MRGELEKLRFDNGVTVKELQLERNLSKTVIDRKDSELTTLSMTLQQTVDENSNLKSKLREIGGGDKNAITTLQTELDKIKGELKERDVAIAKLTTENQNLEGYLAEAAKTEIFLSEELERFKYGIVPNDAVEPTPPPGEVEQTPTPEPTPIPTPPEPEPPEPTPEPVTEPESPPTPVIVNPESTPTPTKQKLTAKTKAKPKAIKKPQPETLLLDSIDGTVAVGELMNHIREMKKDNPNFPDPPEKTQTFTDAATGQTQRMNELEKLYGFNLAGYIMKGKKREYRYKIS